MWWLKCASTPARYSPASHFHAWRRSRRCSREVANENTRRPNLGSPGGPIMISPHRQVVIELTFEAPAPSPRHAAWPGRLAILLRRPAVVTALRRFARAGAVRGIHGAVE